MTHSHRERATTKDPARLTIAEFTDPRLVAIYDTVNSYEPGTQPDFYLQLARELGARTVIDFGCGTGLITREFARRGYKVIGVDPAPAMIDVARHRPSGDLVRWVEGDASELGTPHADLAIMSGHVAQFFLTDEAWHTALVALHGALRLGGRLAFESRNPLVRDWENWTREARWSVHDPNAGQIDTWCEVEQVHDEIVSCTNHYVFMSTGEELISPVKLRFRTEAQLVRALADVGFVVEHLYGDWDRRQATPTTRELIVVAGR